MMKCADVTLSSRRIHQRDRYLGYAQDGWRLPHE